MFRQRSHFRPTPGLIFALDTYISQAYGAKNFKLIGIVFQNCMVICTLLSVPIAIAWWFTEPLLLLLGQGAESSKLAGEFTKWSIPGVLPYLYYRTIMRYLQNQHIMMPGNVPPPTRFFANFPRKTHRRRLQLFTSESLESFRISL